MGYETMRRMERTHRCSECKGPLVTVWDGKANEHRLVCGQHREHVSYERIKSLREEWRAGQPIPIEIAEKLRKKYGGEPMNSQALQQLGPIKMAQRVEMARWPQELTLAQKKLITEIALTYGFDPLFGELTIYQGAPYVCISGRRRKAQETGELDGMQSRPGTSEERVARKLAEGDYLGYCQVWRKGSAHPFEGYRVVTAEAIERLRQTAKTKGHDPYFLPLVNDPQGMAEKRAEALALSRGFYIPLPSAEDVEPGLGTISVRVVNGGTGEIKEESESPPSPPAVAPGAPPEAPKPAARPEMPLANGAPLPTPKPGAAIGKNTLGLINWHVQTTGKDLASILKVKGWGSAALDQLTEAQGQEILRELKGQKA